MAPASRSTPCPDSAPDKMPHARWFKPPFRHSQPMPAGGVSGVVDSQDALSLPTGPYERVCPTADWLKVNKPRSKLIVLTPTPASHLRVEPRAPSPAQTGNDRVPHANAEVTSVDPTSMSLVHHGRDDPRRCDNLISRHRAGIPPICHGRAESTPPKAGSAGVNASSYASTVSSAGKVHHRRAPAPPPSRKPATPPGG